MRAFLKTGYLAWVAVALLLAGCGDEESTSGTAASGAGGTAGTGGVDGASGGVATGGTGAQPGTCPPPGPLLPWFGPWMSGPNPGPCSLVQNGVTTTYVYDAAGVLLRGEVSGGSTETYTRDAMGRITGIDRGELRFEFSYPTPETIEERQYQSGSLTTVKQHTLDATGRPTVFVAGASISGEYLYEDCRVVRVAYTTAAGPVELSYVYDAAGNLVERTDGMIFDYSCW